MDSAITSTAAANKQTVQALLSAFGAGDEARIDSLLAPHFVGHGMPPHVPADTEGFKQCCRVTHAALTQCRNDVESLIAEDDLVAVRYTTTATHTGDFFGAAPSGRTVTMTGIELYRVEDDRVVEAWWEGDMSELFAGALPEHAASG